MLIKILKAKKGIVSDLTADISGVFLFIIIVLFFIMLFQIKSCTRSEYVFNSNFYYKDNNYYEKELLKIFDLNSGLTIKQLSDDKIYEKNLTIKDLICLSLVNKSVILYDPLNNHNVIFNDAELMNYSLDLIYNYSKLNYKIYSNRQYIITNFELVSIDIFFHNAKPIIKRFKPKGGFSQFYLFNNVIACLNDSAYVRVGYAVRKKGEV